MNLIKKILASVNMVNETNKRAEEFNNIMDFANSVLKEFNTRKQYGYNEIEVKENPLIDVIRVLGKKLQTEYLTYLLSTEEVSTKDNIVARRVMFETFTPINENGLKLDSLMKEIQSDKKIFLNKDVVLPWAWERTRLINCIARIGEGRHCGKWEQDNNHTTELWLPMGITWVSSGNHSISTGIIQGDGVLAPTKIYDMSQIYDYIYCDGIYYRLKFDNSIFQSVSNVEFAAIFEIGRLMIENNISF